MSPFLPQLHVSWPEHMGGLGLGCLEEAHRKESPWSGRWTSGPPWHWSENCHRLCLVGHPSWELSVLLSVEVSDCTFFGEGEMKVLSNKKSVGPRALRNPGHNSHSGSSHTYCLSAFLSTQYIKCPRCPRSKHILYNSCDLHCALHTSLCCDKVPRRAIEGRTADLGSHCLPFFFSLEPQLWNSAACM